MIVHFNLMHRNNLYNQSVIYHINHFLCTRLISRQGYTIVDETNRPQFTDDEWPWVTSANVTSISEQTCDVDHNVVRL